jgi:NAD(P)H-dependent FMN reductase
MPRIQVVIGSTHWGGFSEMVRIWVTDRLVTRADFSLDTLDLREYPLALPDPAPVTIGRCSTADEEVAPLRREVDAADGYLVLTAEYEDGYPPTLRNAMTQAPAIWWRKPIAFVGWGNVGGNTIEQLRQMAVEFEMAPVRRTVHIHPEAMRRAIGATDPSDISAFTHLIAELDELADDLLWWAAALATARRGCESRPPASPPDAP